MHMCTCSSIMCTSMCIIENTEGLEVIHVYSNAKIVPTTHNMSIIMPKSVLCGSAGTVQSRAINNPRIKGICSSRLCGITFIM